MQKTIVKKHDFIKRLLLIGIGIFYCSFSVSADNTDILPAKVVDDWFVELSNWGRWGKDDQKGTLNLITPETRIAAAKLVTKGISLSLAHNALMEKTIDNPRPYSHEMIANESSPDAMGYAMDRISVAYHGAVHSHVDAVCHISYRGNLYNNVPAASITERGCARLSVMAIDQGIFGRGILMDIPRLKGVPWLQPGTPIYAADLEAWEKKSGLKVRSGDILLIRTGFWARRASKGPMDSSAGRQLPGLHVSAVAWLHKRGVAVLGSDAGADVHPSGVDSHSYPVHLLAMVALGMPILDSLDLEALSKAAADHKRWEFLFTAAPLKVEGATGSPLNPIAIF